MKNLCKNCIYFNKYQSECMLKNDKKVNGDIPKCKEGK